MTSPSKEKRMLESVAITDIGKRRKLNQDNVYAAREKIGNLPNIFIVADGMGGHNGGELASKWTIEVMLQYIGAASAKNPVKLLEQALQAANTEIRRMSYEDAALYGMGTTIVAATLNGNKLQVANVGDSRLYVVCPKNKTIRQVTRDHSLVEEMVRQGGLTKEAAFNHPDKHIITRVIGAENNVRVDFFDEELKPGELVLLCSDGLTNMLFDEEIGEILYRDKNIIDKANELIKAANDNGGKDNIAVILVSQSH
jgi:protein phosphatase